MDLAQILVKAGLYSTFGFAFILWIMMIVSRHPDDDPVDVGRPGYDFQSDKEFGASRTIAIFDFGRRRHDVSYPRRVVHRVLGVGLALSLTTFSLGLGLLIFSVRA